MDLEALLSIFAVAVLLFLSGFFSGSETSLTAASRPRMHNLEQQGNARAGMVNRLWSRKERLIGAILLGNNLVNIMASAIATGVLIRYFGDTGVLYATVIMTALVLIFAEVLPKTYALHNTDRMALAVAPIMRVVTLAFSPVSQSVEVIVRLTLRAFGVRIDRPYAGDSEEELRGAIDLHSGDAEARHERHMLRSILDLDELVVEEIMVHRRNVVAIDAELPPKRIVEEVLASPYTRLPLWRGESDNIIGVLHAKALLRSVQASQGDLDKLDIAAIANPPWFIPESTDLFSQLHAFRERQEHFAFVIDEYGEMLGIVTLEDILEEIVGEIEDEHDVAVEGVDRLKDGSAIVSGDVTLRDINRRCDWKLPDEEASTVAGLVLYEARRIPDVGQVFTFHGYRFEILGRERNRITLVKVARLSDEPPELIDEEAAETAAG
ncbi:MAG: HlyC/CorC family transporter [Rhodovibrionaceae bacterium]